MNKFTIILEIIIPLINMLIFTVGNIVWRIMENICVFRIKNLTTLSDAAKCRSFTTNNVFIDDI